MKTYTVYFSEPVTIKYKGDRFNKELKKWEHDVDCEETSPVFTFHSLAPAKKLIKENMDKYIDSIITKTWANGDRDIQGEIKKRNALHDTLQTIFLLSTRYTFVTMAIGVSKGEGSGMNNREGKDPMA